MDLLVPWQKQHVQDKTELIVRCNCSVNGDVKIVQWNIAELTVKWNDSVNGDVKITQWLACKDIVHTLHL